MEISKNFKKIINFLKKKQQQNIEKVVDKKIEEYEKKENNNFIEIKKLLEKNNEASKASLRHDLVYIYYKYYDKKELPLNVKEDVFSLYEAYHSLDGNGYIEQIFSEMKEWKIKY